MLSQALRYIARIGADYVVFENLFNIRRRYVGSPTANRKITRSARKQMLTHGVIKALRLGFNIILVDPKGTTNSEEHERIMKKLGLDRHMASAYLIALRGLSKINNNYKPT